jgi:hypothetical protein
MRFSSTPVVRLKSSLRHSWNSPDEKKTVRLAVTKPSVKKGARRLLLETSAKRRLGKIFKLVFGVRRPLNAVKGINPFLLR